MEGQDGEAEDEISALIAPSEFLRHGAYLSNLVIRVFVKCSLTSREGSFTARTIYQSYVHAE